MVVVVGDPLRRRKRSVSVEEGEEGEWRRVQECSKQVSPRVHELPGTRVNSTVRINYGKHAQAFDS